MLTIIEYPDRARYARYAVYLQGFNGECAQIAEGPTQEIAMDDAIAYVRDAMRDPKCSVSRETTPKTVREVLAALSTEQWYGIDSGKVVTTDRALSPAEYAAKYADRAPWPSPEKVYR